jgi:hypothetical protein
MAGTGTASRQFLGPESVTPERLTSLLRKGGVLDTASVTGVTTSVIGAGAGFMGQLIHATLTYDRQEPDAPATLIVKLPAAHPENREVASFFRFYEREVRFYQQIADEVALRTPRCYYSHFDPDSGDYVLLIEDLAPAVVGDQLGGCLAEQADLCIGQLAKFHATWWDSDALEQLDWLPALSDEWYIQSVEQGYAQAWEPFLGFFGNRVSPKLHDVAKRFGAQIRPLMARFGSSPRTIIHGDYRLDNLFFAPPGAADQLAVADWQIAAKGRGVFDVAYFTAGTMPPQERKAAERGLLRAYHEALTAGGVSGYTSDQCWEDYRASVLFCLVYAVIAIGSLDLANERGVELFTTVAGRTFAAIDDLKSYELMD